MNPALRALRPYPMAELQARKNALQKAGRTLIDFGIGDPIEATAPFIREALQAAVPEISQYPSVAGSTELRMAAAAYLARRFGVRLDPNKDILPSAGSKEAIFHLPLAFCDASQGKDTVIYGSPAYPVYEHGALFANAKTHVVELCASQGFRLELSDIDCDVLKRAAIVWLNYPHNPSGACVDGDYYRRQLEVCREHDIILASDECYTDLWFDGASPPPSALCAGSGHLLVFQSCSKRSGMTGYRSGFIAGDSSLIAAYRRWRAAMGLASPAFVEAAGAAAWNDDAHAGERRSIFARKRRIIADALSAKGSEVNPSDAGLYVWARIPKGYASSDAYAETLLEAGIIVSPGAAFGPGGEGWFRMALVPSIEDCQSAMDAWPS